MVGGVHQEIAYARLLWKLKYFPREGKLANWQYLSMGIMLNICFNVFLLIFIFFVH